MPQVLSLSVLHRSAPVGINASTGASLSRYAPSVCDGGELAEYYKAIL
jgi:hypothetical protein